MSEGTVKWFNAKKGYGFIVPDQAGPDVFVHITALARTSIKGLAEGQRLQYELRQERGKTVAAGLKLIDTPKGETAHAHEQGTRA